MAGLDLLVPFGAMPKGTRPERAEPLLQRVNGVEGKGDCLKNIPPFFFSK